MDDKRLADKPLSDDVKADLVRDYHQLLHKFAVWAYRLKRGRYFGTHDDWYQEAALALIECAERWDPSRGIRFITFAYAWVRGRLLQKAENAGLIHVPRTTTTRYLKEHEIALRAMGDAYIADMPIEEPDEPPEVSLSALTPKQRVVIRRFYGFDGPEESQTEIARSLGVGRAAVSLRHIKALEVLWQEAQR